MLIDELIERLQLIRIEHSYYASLEVVMCTQAGSGGIDVVTAAPNPATNRMEVLLQEKP